jgi:hypothetical protein
VFGMALLEQRNRIGAPELAVRQMPALRRRRSKRPLALLPSCQGIHGQRHDAQRRG